MDTNKGSGKHEEMLSGRGTGSMGLTDFPSRGSSNTLGVEIRKSSDSLVLYDCVPICVHPYYYYV